MFHPGALGQSGAITGNSIRSTFEDSGGDWWIGADDGRLLRHRGQDSQFEDASAALAPLFPAPPPAAPLRAMAFLPASEHIAWVATSRGLARLDTRSGVASEVDIPGLEGSGIRSLRARSRRQPVAWHLRPRTDALLARKRTAAAVWQCGGRLSQPGLFGPRRSAWARLERHRRWPRPGRSGYGSHAPFPPSSRQLDSLGGNLVRSVLETADGSIWIASHSGLSRVRESADVGIGFEHSLTEALGDAPVPVVFDLVESPRGGCCGSAPTAACCASSLPSGWCAATA
jgi:hypothetical protein